VGRIHLLQQSGHQLKDLLDTAILFEILNIAQGNFGLGRRGYARFLVGIVVVVIVVVPGIGPAGLALVAFASIAIPAATTRRWIVRTIHTKCRSSTSDPLAQSLAYFPLRVKGSQVLLEGVTGIPNNSRVNGFTE
jgi:hypothetical protein